MLATLAPATLPLTRRTMANWPSYRTATANGRRCMKARVSESDLLALERLEANLAACGEPSSWWYELPGRAQERLKPEVLSRLLQGLRLTEDAIPDLTRALYPGDGNRRGWLETDLCRRVARGDDPPRTLVSRALPAERPRPVPEYPQPTRAQPIEPDPFHEEKPMPAAPPAPHLNGNGRHVESLETTTTESLIGPPTGDGLKEMLEHHARRLAVNWKERFTEELVGKLATLTGSAPEKVSRALRDMRAAKGIAILPPRVKKPAPPEYKPMDLPEGSLLAKVWAEVERRGLDIREQAPLDVKVEIGAAVGADASQVSGAFGRLREKQGVQGARGGYRGAPPRKLEPAPTVDTAAPEVMQDPPLPPPVTIPPAPAVDAQARGVAVLLAGKLAAVAGDDKDALLRAVGLLERVL